MENMYQTINYLDGTQLHLMLRAREVPLSSLKVLEAAQTINSKIH